MIFARIVRQCSPSVRRIGEWLIGPATKPLHSRYGADRDRTDDLLLANRTRQENLELKWDWPDWREPRQTPSLSGSWHMTEGKWEQPAFPRFPIHAPSDVRPVFAVEDEMDACSECGGTVIKEADGHYRCPNCGVAF